MPLPLLVLISVIEVAICLAAGWLTTMPWLTELALAGAAAQGMAAGLVLRRFWHAGPTKAIFGAGGRFLAFEAMVVFCAAEAHAVGTSFGTGGPPLSALLLAPPIVLAIMALRSAGHATRTDEREAEGERERE
ncbi:MAG TPA: hypothetical protein VKA44_06470 [Gemmatimonadota bacterium]|nr:hypothetical protein [Gemmatimonadota bacterium]